MLFSENFKIALRALHANKLRSILTMLGIVIGVATVVALLSIGKGATASITSSIQSNGSNLLTVSPGKQQRGGPNSGQSQQSSHLYYADYQLLQRSLVKNVAAIAPSFQSSYLVKYDNESFTVNVTGVTKDYQETNSYKVASGNFISDGDNKSQSLVAVLGSQTAEDLFGGLTPIGKTIAAFGIDAAQALMGLKRMGLFERVRLRCETMPVVAVERCRDADASEQHGAKNGPAQLRKERRHEPTLRETRIETFEDSGAGDGPGSALPDRLARGERSIGSFVTVTRTARMDRSRSAIFSTDSRSRRVSGARPATTIVPCKPTNSTGPSVPSRLAVGATASAVGKPEGKVCKCAFVL